MKVDPTGLYIGTGILAAASIGLFAVKKGPLRIFCGLLCIMLMVEFALQLLPFPARDVRRDTWWTIHLPCALLLGANETAERHGVLLSTMAHLGDLVLWAALFSVPLILKRAIRHKHGAKTKDAHGAALSA